MSRGRVVDDELLVTQDWPDTPAEVAPCGLALVALAVLASAVALVAGGAALVWWLVTR